MNAIQSKINVVKSRIAQIEISDMFSDEEKEILLRANTTELNALIKDLPVNSQPYLTAQN